MELYDSIIKGTEALLGASAPKHYEYDPARAWEDMGTNQLVMMKEAAFELGGSNLPAANYSCVTTGDLVEKDEIVVYGRELSELKADSCFARIALVKVRTLEGEGEDDTEPVFRAIQDIDFVKYHVYPKGYMGRTSSDSFREQVRVSKDAISRGISFEKIGCDYIRKYKENPNILAVKLIFVTAEDADYAELRSNAKKVADITKTLSKILEGMPTDCHSCNLKEICDEVEGLRDLHFGKKAAEFK